MEFNIYLFFSLLTLLGNASANPINAFEDRDCMLDPSGIYVGISSQAKFLEDNSNLRWIQIYWYGIPMKPGDYVGLWDHDPTENSDQLLEAHQVEGLDGSVTLNTTWNDSDFPTTIEDGMKCLPYWAGYVQNNTVLYSSCLSVNPTWMMDNRKMISSMKIAEIILPGRHDAGAYVTPDLFIKGDSEIGKWTYTEDQSMWQQMVLGVRYFDMRPSYYPNSKEIYFINHGDVRIRPLVDYLNQTVNFISGSEEIIVFDIHALEYGFASSDEEARNGLIDLIISYFGNWMAPRDLGPNPTLETLWSKDKRLIVTFPEPTSSNLFWDSVHHLWGNVNELDDLYYYMNTNIPQMSGVGSMWSCMMQFTPSTLDVAVNRWNGLRGAANITNPPVTLWFRRDWWTMVNIISMDYILSSDVINSAIEGNLRRYSCNLTISSSQNSDDFSKSKLLWNHKPASLSNWVYTVYSM